MDSYRSSDISVEAQLSLFFYTCYDPGLSSCYEFKVKDKALGRYLGGIFAKNFGCLRLSELPTRNTRFLVFFVSTECSRQPLPIRNSVLTIEHGWALLNYKRKLRDRALRHHLAPRVGLPRAEILRVGAAPCVAAIVWLDPLTDC